jgi:hypothetical protein
MVDTGKFTFIARLRALSFTATSAPPAAMYLQTLPLNQQV